MWVSARHQLVWLSEAGWRAAKASVQQRESARQLEAVLTRWQENRWPLVVCRQDPDAAPGEICLGIALPPSAEHPGKQRIALRLAGPMTNFADRMFIGYGIVEGLRVAPARWRPALEAFCKACKMPYLSFYLYGSLAWQAATGLEYLTASSDIDLRFHPQTRAQLQHGLALLASSAEALPLDGEIVFPSGRAVAWKEWRQVFRANGGDADSGAKVLVKEYAKVALMSVAELLATLGDE